MITKIAVLSTLALFIWVPTAFAQTTTQPTPMAEVFATVNIYNATTTSQTGNTFTIDFDISNREGVQPGVRYGVSLVKMSGGAITTVADEHVYDETLTLGAGEMVHKTITYTAPASLSGEYTLMLGSKSSSGVPFATKLLGKVTLQGKKETVSIDPVSCFVTVSGEQNVKHMLDTLVSIGSVDAVSLHCTATNSTKESVTLAPSIVQRLRSTYGDIVPSSAAIESIVVAPQAKFDFTISIPKVTEAQKYYVVVSLHDATRETNAVTFRYALRGAGASIRTLLLDKDMYAKGDTAMISFIWSSLVDTVAKGEYAVSAPLASLVATFSITDGNGVSCGAPVTIPLTSSERLTKASFPITTDCRNPKVQATLADVTAGTLDAQSFSVTSRGATPSFFANLLAFMKNIYVIIGSIVLALLFSIVLYKRRASLPIVMLLFAFTLFGGVNTARADSATLYYGCGGGTITCPQATAIWAWGGLDQSSYTPGQNVIFQVSMASDDNPQLSTGVTPVAYGAINTAGFTGDVFPGTYSPEDLRGGISGSISLGTAPSSSGYVRTYYGAGGYSGTSGSIPFTVIAPPSVSLYFQ